MNPALVVPDNFDEKYLLIVGDFFSFERWRHHSNNLMDINNDLEFEQQYKQC